MSSTSHGMKARSCWTCARTQDTYVGSGLQFSGTWLAPKWQGTDWVVHACRCFSVRRRRHWMRVHVYIAFVYIPAWLLGTVNPCKSQYLTRLKTQVLLRANPGNILCCFPAMAVSRVLFIGDSSLYCCRILEVNHRLGPSSWSPQ